MRNDEFERWLPQLREGYATDIMRNGGASDGDARKKAIVDTERVFPYGQPSPDQFVFVVEADAEPVGELWVAEREGDLGRGLWIYDVHIEEAHRGRGYGKEAMLLAEEEARRRGLSRVALNVFGGNAAARGLYQSLGYLETAVLMSKRV
jgi:ribosomal protein S18 acetylase RimI-like enzyme